MADTHALKCLLANLASCRDATKVLLHHMLVRDFSFALIPDPDTRDYNIPNVPNAFHSFHANQHPRLVLLARAPGSDLFPLYGVVFGLGGDFNATRSLRGPVVGDERGTQLVQFACGNNLHILNHPHSIPTFETPYVRSWIGVTLASISLVGNGGYQQLVSEEDTLSDHKYIEFSLRDAASVPEKRLRNYARAQLLEVFCRDRWFKCICRCRFSSAWMPAAVVDRFYAAYRALCKKYMRTVKPLGEGAKHRWTPQLSEERSRVCAMRRRYQSLRDPAVHDVFPAQYA
ncbi:hypothetical protein HPB49_018290 [Dermacentor silvarum]|uniref:Uncharacterized protein n=1 Tax=Dermacentor silvarum TaxID=543639 RepID=A0ACB8CGH7_DERSI|nr:hypothetical protein HPB49_018290 [Dermacentor silvarum]